MMRTPHVCLAASAALLWALAAAAEICGTLACIEPARARAAGLLEAGEYAQARGLLEDALERTAGEARAAVALELGWAEYRLGNHAAALEMYALADALVAADDEATLALLAYRTGVALRESGEYDAAVSRLKEARDLARALDDAELLARSLNGLGGIAYYRSDFAGAVELFSRALEAQHAGGADPLDIAATLNNLALMHLELGDSARALELFRETERIREERLGSRHPLLVSTRFNLGMVAEARGDTVEAGRLYANALDIAEKEVSPEHPYVAIALDGLGRVRRMESRYREALALHQRALDLRRRTLGPNDPYLADSLNHVAAAQMDLANAGRARDRWSESLVIGEASSEPALVIDAYEGLARASATLGQVDLGIVFGKLAVMEIQSVREDLEPLPEDLERGYASRREPVYRTLANLLIDRGRLPEASAALDLVRNEELYQYSRGRWVDRASDGLPLSEPELELASAFLAARETLRQQAPGDDARDAYREALVALVRQRPALPARAASVARPPDGPVAAETARLRYIVDRDAVRVLVQTTDGAIHRTVAVGQTELNQAAFAFREAVADPEADPRPAGRALYAALIEPVDSALNAADVTRLELSLDGVIRYVPFAPLYDGERFLVERYEIVRAPGGRRANPEGDAATMTVAGFGITKAPVGLPPLPYVREELETIVRRGPDDPDGALSGDIYLDEAFSLEALERVSGEPVPNVHIASHFVFRPGRVTDSYLVVGSGPPVTLADFAGLDLSGVRWLALSACETALGDAFGRGVEIDGLGALARSQGAGTVLASLWRVSDRATSSFMRRLYHERAAGRDEAAALRAAQLDALYGDTAASSPFLLGDDPRAPYAHPYFWGAFVVMTN